MRFSKATGFTLVEIMVAVAILSILAVIVLPTYQQSVRKSRRADAQSALLNMQLQEEKWRANNNSYNATASAVGAPAATEKVSNYYTFSVTNVGATTFTVQAVAKTTGGQDQDKQYSSTSCATLTLDQSGTRTPTACW